MGINNLGKVFEKSGKEQEGPKKKYYNKDVCPKKKKDPLRYCVGCREKHPRSEMARVVTGWVLDNGAKIDRYGTMSGRSTYICMNMDCVEQAKKTKAFERVFVGRVDPRFYRELEEEFPIIREIRRKEKEEYEAALKLYEVRRAARERGEDPDAAEAALMAEEAAKAEAILAEQAAEKAADDARAAAREKEEYEAMTAIYEARRAAREKGEDPDEAEKAVRQALEANKAAE